MQFSTLSNYFQKIELTDKRLEMTEILAQLFSKTEADEIDKACYFSLGILAPKFKNINLNLAQKMMERAISQALSISQTVLVSDFKNTGDLGISYEKFAQENKSKLSIKNLEINDVYDKLKKIARQEGEGSQDHKINLMSDLLKSINPKSGKYLTRTAIGKLRLGFSTMTILDALSWMETGNKSLRPELENAYNICADVGYIAQIFLSSGLEKIKKMSPHTGIPIVPARATPLKDPKEILEKHGGQTALEPKFDGFRIQVHIDKSKQFFLRKEADLSLFEQAQKQAFVAVYSRNLEDITYMFPDLVEASQNLQVNNVILDGEAVAFDPKTHKLLDFQETVKRKRKHNINSVKEEIPINGFIFDILFLNNEPLIKMPLSKRRQKLENLFSNFKSRNFSLTQQKIVDNPEAFDAYFNQVAEAGMEGLMAKKIDGIYQAGARDFTWIKYKVAMQSELADTIDAVVLGYFKGEGKWSKFGLGRVLIGVPDKNKLRAISRVGSGFSEEKIKQMYNLCQKIKTNKKPANYIVDKNLTPDVWVEPKILIEIRADSISRSPLYSTGLSLRFPRFIRFRNDKESQEATTLDQIKSFV